MILGKCFNYGVDVGEAVTVSSVPAPGKTEAGLATPVPEGLVLDGQV